MAKGNRIPWSEWEEQNLPSWLSHNEHLTWAKKEERYFQEFGIPRTIQSIRGKINQEKQKSQFFPGGTSANPHLTARKARRRRLRDLNSSSLHTLACRPRAFSTGSHQTSLDKTSQAKTASDVALDQYGPEFRLCHSVSGKTLRLYSFRTKRWRSWKTIRAEMDFEPVLLTRKEHPKVMSHLWSAVYRLIGRK